MSQQLNKILVILLIGLVVSLILLGIDQMFVMWVGLMGHIVFVITMIVLLKNVTRLFVFPGSFWLWRRNVETKYAKALAKRAHLRVKDAILIIQYFTSGELHMGVDDIQPIKKTMNSFIGTFTELMYKGTINLEQRQLLNLFTQVVESMKQIRFEQGNLYELLDMPDILLTITRSKIQPIDGVVCDQIIPSLWRIEGILYNVYCNKSIWRSIERWYCNRTLGTAQQMRVELEHSFPTKRYQVKSFDGAIIDCLFIEAPRTSGISPTVLFCQPNAGYYEYMFYESDWIDYYTKRRVNMFLWNYRGYVETEGLPNTQAILKDAETLVDFINKEMPDSELIIHGESLGGMVACHLGKTKQATMLFADRTFSSISNIATVGFSKYARFLFNFITSWNYDSAASFVDCTYYKVLAMDVKDELIPYLSSLKVEVCKKVFIREISNNNDESFREVSRLQLVEKWRWKCRWMFGQKDEFQEVWYTAILSKGDTISFFDALKRVQNVMLELSINKKQRSTDESINMSVIETQKNDSSYIENSLSENRQLGETQLEDEVYTSDYQNTKLQYQLSEQDKSSQQLQAFIVQVFGFFDSIEAAGLSLMDVFNSVVEHQQYDVFMDYLLSIFFWGSYLPIKYIHRKKMTTLICQKLAYARLTASMTKLEGLIKQEKQKSDTLIQTKVVLDLELILSRFKALRENFKKALRSKSSSQVVFNVEMQPVDTEFRLDDKHTGKLQGNKVMDPINRQLGCFIPLSCGHNGILTEQEIQVLDFHMSQAGIIK